MPVRTLRELSNDVLLLTNPPTRQQKSFALVVAVVVTLVFTAALPFRNHTLPRIDSFIPVVDTVLVLGDLLTAVLLFTQAVTLRSRSLVALAGGYLYTGLIIIPHGLSFPGAFSSGGLLGAGASTTVWLNIAWHMGLPIAAIVSALTREADDRKPLPAGEMRRIVAASIALCGALALLLTLLATRGATFLPELMVDARIWIPARLNIAALLPVTLSAAAIVALLWHRRTLIDLWLLLVIWGWLLETLMAMVTTARFSFGWYVGRIAALVAGILVLVMLLTEITRLYSRLALLVTVRQRDREGRSLTMNAVAAAMAHEIKQPLASIVASAGAGMASLRRTPADMKLIAELFESIEGSGMSAGNVIDSIRAMFAQQPIQRVRLDMSELLHEALALIRSEADASRVVLLVRHDPVPLVFDGDHLQVKHVLLNLLINAIEAMKPVTDRARLMQIAAKRHGSEILVTITDSGVGFANAGMHRLFEPFYTTKPEGTGMGLPLCRSIMELHGGRIWAAPGPSYGAVLSFSLPSVA